MNLIWGSGVAENGRESALKECRLGCLLSPRQTGNGSTYSNEALGRSMEKGSKYFPAVYHNAVTSQREAEG